MSRKRSRRSGADVVDGVGTGHEGDTEEGGGDGESPVPVSDPLEAVPADGLEEGGKRVRVRSPPASPLAPPRAADRAPSPPPTPKVVTPSRPRRTRQKPADYWTNERPVYNADRSLVSPAVSRTPTEQPDWYKRFSLSDQALHPVGATAQGKLKAKAKRRRRAGSEASIDSAAQAAAIDAVAAETPEVPRPVRRPAGGAIPNLSACLAKAHAAPTVSDANIVPAQQWFKDKARRSSVVCSRWEDLTWQSAADSGATAHVATAIAFHEPEYQAGLLHMSPSGELPTASSEGHFVLCVVAAQHKAIEVKLGSTTFLLSPGDQAAVPPGSSFGVRNLSSDFGAQIHWCRVACP